MMDSFNYYPQAWALYILLGCVLLVLLYLPLRKTGFKRRVAILSLVAVGAFTPQTVTDTDSLAPLILNSLLNAEVEGISSIYEGLITLVIIWGILFASILAIKHFIDAKKSSTNKPSKKA